MKKRVLILIILLFTVTLSGCAKDEDRVSNLDPSEIMDQAPTENEYTIDPGQSNTEPLSSPDIPALDNRKIVYKADVLVIVDDLEALKTELFTLIDDNLAYYDEYEETNNRLTINLRVPSANYHQFLDDISDTGEVASMSQTAEDITNSYSTFQARKEALEAQYTAVQTLIADATKLSDILTLRDELANIETELNNIGKTLDNYDDLVDYSTINLTVTKLEDLSLLLDKSTDPYVSVTETTKSELLVEVRNYSEEKGTVYLKLIQNGEVKHNFTAEIFGNGTTEFVIKELQSGTEYRLEATFLEANHRISNYSSETVTTEHTFGSRLVTTFNISTHSLLILIQTLGIIITFLIPYLIVVLILFFPAKYLNNRFLKPRRQEKRIARMKQAELRRQHQINQRQQFNQNQPQNNQK